MDDGFSIHLERRCPKVVSDGLHEYAVLCGSGGSDHACGIEKRRGLESWTQGTWTFSSNQPAVVLIDRKGRLNVFYNDLLLHHVRFDHPSIEHYFYDYAADGSFTVTYCYTAGAYYQVYVGGSSGAFRYYNSDGYEVSRAAPQITAYWYPDTRDGSRDYVYIYNDPARAIYYWYVIDYDVTGAAWEKTYVYYQGAYWLMEFTGSDGHFRRSDSTGMNQVG